MSDDDPIDAGFGPLLEGEKPYEAPAEVTATVTELTEEGIQAAKALIPTLPKLTVVDLAKLARDIAMDIKERHVILKEYGLDQVQYEFLENHNAVYKNALQAACIEWHAPLSTNERVSISAAAILEDSLPILGARMQNKAEGLPGVIEAAKFFGKLSGIGERAAGGSGTAERFVINIDLGADKKLTLAAEAPSEGVSAAPAFSLQLPQISGTPVGSEEVQQQSEGSGRPIPVRREPEGS